MGEFTIDLLHDFLVATFFVSYYAWGGWRTVVLGAVGWAAGRWLTMR
jgi:hypothetical protein